MPADRRVLCPVCNAIIGEELEAPGDGGRRWARCPDCGAALVIRPGGRVALRTNTASDLPLRGFIIGTSLVGVVLGAFLGLAGGLAALRDAQRQRAGWIRGDMAAVGDLVEAVAYSCGGLTCGALVLGLIGAALGAGVGLTWRRRHSSS